MTSRYLNPKIDLAFKRVFGEHANLLKSFLNALLPLPEGGLIESLEYLTPEQVPEIPGLFKNSIVDVKCKDTQGRIFIVEMQMLWSNSFTQRILFSASQAYVKQMRVGQYYDTLQPVYALALSNQVFDLDSPAYYHHYKIVNVEHPKQTVIKGLEFVFIELPKFKAQNATDRRMQVKWLQFLSEVGENDKTLPADLQADKDIGEALRLVEVSAYTEEQIEIYHIHMDKSRIEGTVIADALAKGKAEGKAEGRAEGKAEGLAEGKAEAQAELLKALFASGMSAEQISSITQLPLEQVRRSLA